jgi:diguanylate cyclase (GGDEF)-like protein
MTTELTDTWKTILKRPQNCQSGTALLVRIYPTGPGLGRCYPLSERPFVIGREEQCDLPSYHHSVSRRHAHIEYQNGAYSVVDLQSTNGTFVNDQPVSKAKLKDGDYLRVGACIYRFLASGNIESSYHEEIYRLTIIDALTDVPNKRFLTEFLDRELARVARYQRPLSLVLFDIDRFKTINDRFGHLGGDSTLRELASCIKANIRKEELFARYGGEEFALVLPETDHARAVEICERIRSLVETYAFRCEGMEYRVTISLGVVTTVGDQALTPHELIRRADERLYEAKRAGANRVCA